jgi:hypothetical protein
MREKKFSFFNIVYYFLHLETLGVPAYRGLESQVKSQEDTAEGVRKKKLFRQVCAIEIYLMMKHSPKLELTLILHFPATRKNQKLLPPFAPFFKSASSVPRDDDDDDDAFSASITLLLNLGKPDSASKLQQVALRRKVCLKNCLALAQGCHNGLNANCFCCLNVAENSAQLNGYLIKRLHLD